MVKTGLKQQSKVRCQEFAFGFHTWPCSSRKPQCWAAGHIPACSLQLGKELYGAAEDQQGSALALLLLPGRAMLMF